MLCAKCGASNPQGSAYCGGCGAPLTSESTPLAIAESESPVQEFPLASSAQVPANPGAGGQDMPTFQSISPVPPTPSVSEQVQAVPPVLSQGLPNGQVSQVPEANFSAGAYSPPTPVPGSGSGAYPPAQATPVPGSGSGAYPPAQVTPVPGGGSGAYLPAQPAPAGWGSGAYPAQTPVPGFPSGVYPPPQPTQDFGSGSGAYFPSAGAYPGQPSQPGWNAYAAPGTFPPPQPQAAGPSKLINPLPRWLFIASIVVVAALLALLFFFTGSDWAAGGQTAGIVAFAVGALILIAFGVRAGLGMLAQANPHRRAQVISSLLLVLLLIAVGVVGLTQQNAVHTVQGRVLEGQKNWQQALDEYQAGGQGAPTSEDMARTYIEWGKQLADQGNYSGGIAKFDLVYTTYNQAPTGDAQAKNEAISTYQTWVDADKQNYTAVTQHYDALLNEPYCKNDSACTSKYSALDATAYYQLAEQKLNQQDYKSAVAAFQTLTTRFSSSPESQKAHADYAQALWGEGQQQLTDGQGRSPVNCSDAVTTYQLLSSQFSDTQQGQQATNALKQPQPVKGHFTSSIPGSPYQTIVALMQGITPGMTSDQFYAIFAKSPLANVGSDGKFMFKPVKQDSYYLSWGTLNTSTNNLRFYDTQAYPATVGPLCPFDYGDINETIPLAP